MMISEQIQSYFNSLEAELGRCIEIAKDAKKRGEDPLQSPEILLAKDLADRVESLVGIKGLAQRIRELESQMSREEAALHIGLDFAEGVIGDKFGLDLVEDAIRTAVAILTEGIVAAPIEGIARVGLGKNDDGTDYLKIYYSGPIRSAGGTAQALSVLVADYVRRKVGISEYKPRKEEVERCAEEVLLYKRITNLQYTPSNEEIRLIVNNCPICIDGEPTEEEEVSAYRNLDRIETNRVRGGMVLVLAEGLALKAPKVKSHVSQLGLDGWEWLDNLIVKKYVGDKVSGKKEKFLEGIIAGRPVFSHPSSKGGFRLRYGRSRNSCYATAGIHPATMIMLDDFIATGTQMKVEMPGKAAGITPVDSIEGPTVRLVNGDVLRIDSVEQAYELRPSVEEIIDVGEILINYGDFLENAHPLFPASYCYEWWVQELEDKISVQEDLRDITPERAFELSEKFNVPLHPKYTYLWQDITIQDLGLLAEHISKRGKYDEILKIPSEPIVKELLETLLVPHKVRRDNIIVENALPIIRCIGLDQDLNRVCVPKTYEKTIEAVSAMAGVQIRERAPIRIGSRMGRPEKSKERKMHPPVHVLFPTGGERSRNRSLNGKKGEIEIELGIKKCPTCDITTFKNLCDCGNRTFPIRFCTSCGISSGEKEHCSRCGSNTSSVRKQTIDFGALYAMSLERLGEREPEKFKGVLGLTSKDQTPEPLEKGILRAKNEIYVFKDGTTRYDLTDLPLTHFMPREISTSIDKIIDLDYCIDMCGKPLKNENQVIELRPQDVILSKCAGDYLLRVANFVDELLVKYYGSEAYYKAQYIGDLVGKLVIGLAPHTSAGVLGRILGFTNASVCYAHPFFHAAKRRNCDGDEDCIMLLMDGLLNFSRSYLPDRRGGKMDAPLVLTTRIDPNEIDSEAHNIDLLSRYPLEFYEASMRQVDPKDLETKMDLVGARLGSPMQYEGFYFTHDTSDIAAGPKNSAYKTLGTMIDKMEAQLKLSRKIRAVNARDVAERVIVSHFLPDLIGNLRAFSKQKMRCVRCNARIRRPPLRGTCPKCGGRVILTVHEGSVKKYLDISLKTAEEYGISNYTKQRLHLLELEVRSLFASDKVKQAELVDFM